MLGDPFALLTQQLILTVNVFRFGISQPQTFVSLLQEIPEHGDIVEVDSQGHWGPGSAHIRVAKLEKVFFVALNIDDALKSFEESMQGLQI